MSETAHDLRRTSPTDPGDVDQTPAVPADRGRPCALCEEPLAPDATRCPSCGLWLGSVRDPVSRATLLKVGAAFLALYLVALLVVALAR